MKKFLILTLFILNSLLSGALANSLCVSAIENLDQSTHFTSQEFVRMQARTPISDESNAAFIQHLQNPKKGSLYIDIDNRVLKELNDKIIEDKSLIDALDTSFKQDVLRMCQESPTLRPHLQGAGDPSLAGRLSEQYYDYKSLRLIIDQNTPAIKKELEQIYRQAGVRLRDRAHSIVLQDGRPLTAKIKTYKGLAQDPSTWYLMGEGENPYQAAYASRMARKDYDEKLMNQSLKLKTFAEAHDEVLNAFKGLELDRIALQEKYAATELMEEISKNPKIFSLSESLIDLIKKNKGAFDIKAPLPSEYIDNLREAIKTRYHIDIPDEELLRFKNIYNNANELSPPLFFDKRQLMEWGDSVNGNVSIDLAGQGAHNIYMLMREMAGKTVKNSDEVIGLAKKSVAAADARLNSLRSQSHKFLDESLGGLDHKKLYMSGDDLVLKPAQTVDQAQRLTMLKTLAKMDNPSSFRVVTLDAKYIDDSSKIINHAKRSELIVKGESLEKNLRKALEKKWGYKASQQLGVLVNVEATVKDQARLVLNIASKGKTASEMAHIKKEMQEIIKKLSETKELSIAEGVESIRLGDVISP